jgi:predicted NBD/HSP70 family sugar kinase
MSYRTGATGLTRDLNRAAILRLIGLSGPIARTSIAERLGLSPATVTSITRELIESGIVRTADRAPSRGGRPALLLEIVSRSAHAFGVKIAPDHLVGVVVDLDGDVIEQFEERLDLTAKQGFDAAVKVLRTWLDTAQAETPLLGVGLGVPGVVDSVTGRVTSPLLGWHDFALRDALQNELGVAVLVDNDVNTLATAERLYGRGRNVEDFIAVTLGRGVGLGIVANGDIYHGHGGGAGEFGHVTAIAEHGPVCSCGKRGCLEAVVADPALVAIAREDGVIGKRQGIAALRRQADAGDVDAHAIFAEAATVLGQAVANLVNVLSPELILVSGEGTQAWAHFEEAFGRSLHAHVFPPLRGVTVEVDPWDDAKWAVGAASLVLRTTFTPLVDGTQHELAMRAWARPDTQATEVVA